MKYIKSYVLFFTLILCLVPNIVKADYECHYKATRTMWGVEIDESNYFKVSTTTNQFTFDKILGLPSSGVIVDSKINSKYTDKYLIEYLDGCCPNEFYVCRSEMGMPGGTQIIKYLVILNGALYEEIDWKDVPLSSDLSAVIGGDPIVDSACMRAVIDTEKTSSCTSNVQFECDSYQKLEDKLRVNYCEKNEQGCTLEKMREYDSSKESIKAYCNRVLSHGDYNINPCVNKCLKLVENIEKIEGSELVDIGECGFSGELMAWIRNIIKYMKYFLPVIVIVLGILDFIKAIASSSDDDMKKAQGKFVKRLIAAALVFLVPLIIGFILDKFGFTVEYCGVFK